MQFLIVTLLNTYEKQPGVKHHCILIKEQNPNVLSGSERPTEFLNSKECLGAETLELYPGGCASVRNS